MKFHDYETHFNWGKGKKMPHTENVQVFTRSYLERMETQARDLGYKELSDLDPFTPALLTLEQRWIESRRPYYDIYPGIIPALLKIKLDVDSGYFRLPVDTLLLRLPVNENHPLRFMHDDKEHRICSILCENSYLHKPFCEPVRAISFWVDINEIIGDGLRRVLYKHILCETGKTIEWSLTNIPAHDSSSDGVLYPDDIIRDITRLICTVCLLASDPEVVVPEVLNGDVSKFEACHDEKYIVRAHGRGKVGWSVGKSIEISPHLRGPCLAALYWTGVGRKIPKIRVRRGSVVHRRKISAIPTGYGS